MTNKLKESGHVRTQRFRLGKILKATVIEKLLLCRQEMAELEAEFHIARGAFNDACAVDEKRAQHLMNACAVADERIVELRKELQQQDKHIKALQEQLSLKRTQIGTLQGERRSLRAEIEMSRDDYSSMQAQRDAGYETRDRYAVALAAIRATVSLSQVS